MLQHNLFIEVSFFERKNDLKNYLNKKIKKDWRNNKSINKTKNIWWKYIQQEQDTIKNLMELNETLHIIKQDELKIIKTDLTQFEKHPTIDILDNYVKNRNNIRDKLKCAVPNLGTEKALLLLKGQKIPLSDLKREEINDIFNSDLRKIISLILGK